MDCNGRRPFLKIMDYLFKFGELLKVLWSKVGIV